MRVSRWWYAGAAALTVAAGLGSRQWTAIPTWVGDLLWATMIFFLVSLLAPALRRRDRAALALLVCYLVEVSQLIHGVWIDRLRSGTIGHLLLGQGFSWGDLLAYTAGVAFAALIDLEIGVLGSGGRGGRSGSRQPAGDSIRDA